MPALTIIDTDILIDAGRGVITAIDFLIDQEKSTKLAISAVTQMELLVGCRNKQEQQQLKRFLRRFQILPITETISNEGVRLLRNYRLSHNLMIADGLIAATAIVWDEPFASKNQKDYRFIPKLQLLRYA